MGDVGVQLCGDVGEPPLLCWWERIDGSRPDSGSHAIDGHSGTGSAITVNGADAGARLVGEPSGERQRGA